jgi:hypothetical protein
MYFSSNAGGTFHIWRQRFPNGQPEQITSGLTEEEGIAMAADGRSLVTAVALKQSTVWVHDKNGERQVSLEGYSYDPEFTPDGKKLLYRILRGALPAYDPAELRALDLNSGQTEPVLPGMLVSGNPGHAYDVSPDGRSVVAVVVDREGKRRLWVTSLDHQSPPRLVPDVQGYAPHLGEGGDIFFASEEQHPKLSHVHTDGTGLQVVGRPGANGMQLLGVSQDRQWALTRDRGTGALIAVSLGDSAAKQIVSNAPSDCRASWSADGKVLFLSMPTSPIASGIIGRTYAVPLSNREMLPRVPPGGFQTLEELAKIPGMRVLEGYDVTPGPTSDIYAFSRASVQRNLYRVPIP